MHLESTKLLPDEFARLVLPRGTTAVVLDPHELANVLGTDGVHWLLDACEGLPLDVYFMASSSIPASEFESPRRPLLSGDLESLLRRRRVLGLAEMMNFPGVVAGDATELDKLRLAEASRSTAMRRACSASELNAYVAAGIRSDHEALTIDEGRERLRAGMWLLIREASMARNLQALLPLVPDFGPNRIAFCTDDRDPEDIAANGHINGMVREAVAAGIAPEDARRDRDDQPGVVARGSGTSARSRRDIRPTCSCSRTSRASVPETHAEVGPARRGDPGAPRAGMGEAFGSQPARHRHRSSGFRGKAAAARAIGLVAGPGRHRFARRGRTDGPSDGMAVADARRRPREDRGDRGGTSGPAASGSASSTTSGLQRGALASTVAHDAHNIVVVGMNDEAMAPRGASGSGARRRHRRRGRSGGAAELPLPSPASWPTRRSQK